jgi:hypothetical protein
MFTPDRYPADVSAGGPNASNLRQPETPALAPSVPSAEPAIASPPKEPASKSRMRLQLRNSMRLIDSLWHRHFEQLTRLDTQADSKHLQTEVQSLVEHLAFCTKHSDELDHVLLLQSAPTYVSVLEVWNRACRQGVWLTTLNPALVSCLRLLVVWAERIPAFYQKHSTRLKWRVSRIYQTFGRALIAAGQVVDNALQ